MYPARMRLTVNGEPREIDARTVDALVAALALPRDRVAIELNGAIVPKAERAGRSLRDGDVLEIVTLVGGG
jgi:thiamine biosynthesis protein ThiS